MGEARTFLRAIGAVVGAALLLASSQARELGVLRRRWHDHASLVHRLEYRGGVDHRSVDHRSVGHR